MKRAITRMGPASPNCSENCGMKGQIAGFCVCIVEVGGSHDGGQNYQGYALFAAAGSVFNSEPDEIAMNEENASDSKSHGNANEDQDSSDDCHQSIYANAGFFNGKAHRLREYPETRNSTVRFPDDGAKGEQQGGHDPGHNQSDAVACPAPISSERLPLALRFWIIIGLALCSWAIVAALAFLVLG